jgi:hypothetical protein
VADLIEPVFGKDDAAKAAPRFAKLILGKDPDENAQMLLSALPT